MESSFDFLLTAVNCLHARLHACHFCKTNPPAEKLAVCQRCWFGECLDALEDERWKKAVSGVLKLLMNTNLLKLHNWTTNTRNNVGYGCCSACYYLLLLYNNNNNIGSFRRERLAAICRRRAGSRVASLDFTHPHRVPKHGHGKEKAGVWQSTGISVAR